MPTLSQFFGITIHMWYNDHPPPHFHARYGSEHALFEIQTLRVIRGQMSPRIRGFVVEWAVQHLPELNRAWEQARNGQPIDTIDPLR